MLERLLARHARFSVAFSLSGTPPRAALGLGAGRPRRLPAAGVGRARRDPRGDVAPFARLARVARRIRRAGRPSPGHGRGDLRPRAAGFPQHGAHLLRRPRGAPGEARIPGRARRRRRAPDRAALGPRRLPGRDARRPAASPSGLPPVRRHRLPLLEPVLERVAADAREVRPLDLPARRRGPLALHGLRDLRRAPGPRDRHLRVLRGLGRTAPRAPRGRFPDAFPGDRGAAARRPALLSPRRCPGRTRRGTCPPGRATTSSATP